MKKLRVVLVGFGGAGRIWFTEVVPEFPEVEVVACVDRDADIRARLTAEYDLPSDRWFATLADALGTVEADAVLIATHLETHAPLTREALDAGKHVLVEKPFTRLPQEAEELAERAADNGVQLVVGQNYRFFPAPQAVKKLLTEGTLGGVVSVRIDFRHNQAFRNTADAKHANLTHPLLLDMAVHHVDLLRMLLGTEPASAYCRGYNPSWSAYREPPAAAGMVTFPDNVVVSYRGSWVSHDEPTTWSGIWDIECENGSIVWQSRRSRTDLSGESVLIRRNDIPDQEIELPGMEHFDRQGAMAAFVDAVRSGTPADCSGADNVGTIRLVDAMIESADTGRVITL